jgi:hypothetical protein
LSPSVSFHEPVQSPAFVSGRVAPTRVFGEPVRGINFCQICNVRDAAPVCFPMYEVQLDNHGDLLPQGFFGKAKSKQAQAQRSPSTTQNGLIRRYNEAYPPDMLIDPATSSSISLGVGFIGSGGMTYAGRHTQTFRVSRTNTDTNHRLRSECSHTFIY